MKVIALVSQKGGSGKSTLAVNLAGALSLRGKTALSDEDAAVRTAQDWLTGSNIPVELVPPDARAFVIKIPRDGRAGTIPRYSVT